MYKSVTPAEKVGKVVGFSLSYFIFTTLVFFIFHFPPSWGYFHVMLVTILIACVGHWIQRWLS